MAEPVRRCGVDVRHPAAAAELRAEVGRRLRTGGRGDAHGQAPGRVHPTRDGSRDRTRSLLAEEEGLEDPVRALGSRAQGVGAPREQRDHARGARVEHGVQQCLLGTGEREALGVAALTARAATEEAGAVAQRDDDDVGIASCGDRRRDLGCLPAVDGRAADEHDVGVRELHAQRLEQGGQLDAERNLRMLHADMRGERVAAEHRIRVVGRGTDDRDAAGGGEREHALVADEHDRALGEFRREGAILGGVQVDGAAQRLRRGAPGRVVERGRHGRPRVVEQAQLDLLQEHPAQRPVDERLVDASRAHLGGEGSAVAAQGRQLHVDAGRERGSGGSAPVLRGHDAVLHGEEAHREVVGDDGAVEAPGVAQKLGEQTHVCRTRHPVEVGVGVHDRTHPALADRHLERRQQHIGHLTRSDRDGREVAPGTRGRVPHEVLERRDDAGPFETLHVRGADRADEVRILADRLLHATPPGIAHDVQHGREALVDAHPAHVGADAARHLAHQVRVEARPPRERHRIRGRTPRGEAREALLVRDGGDAEAVRGDDPLLGALQGQRAQGRVNGGGAERPGQLTQARRQQLVDVDVGGHLVLVGGDLATGRVRPHPDSVQLPELLLERHLGDERLGPLGGGLAGVTPDRRDIDVERHRLSLHGAGETADDAALSGEEEHESRNHRQRGVSEYGTSVL